MVMRVLIVDGSKQKRRDLVEMLGDVANVVIQGAVPDLRSALSALVEVSPDVIVTGSWLPDGDGIHLIHRVRRCARLPAIVVVSDATCDEQRERYLSAGADHYVSDDQLAQALTSLTPRFAVGTIAPEESQRLLGRMTAGVVHDLNNYLNVIEVTVRLLRRPSDDSEQLWRQMRSALDAIARLTANLMTYARGAAVEPQKIELGPMVQDVLALIGRIVPPTVEVTVDIEKRKRVVHGVRPELEQLLLNLLINACDAMPDGGELHVGVRYRSATAVLTVADTGRGMLAPKVNDFVPSTKRPGNGLGLGIVRTVVERHRGALRIQPRETGGTVITVLLPTA